MNTTTRQVQTLITYHNKKNSLQQQTKETQTLITGTLGTNINGLHLNEIVLSPFPNEKNTQTIISGAVFLRSDSLCLNYN